MEITVVGLDMMFPRHFATLLKPYGVTIRSLVAPDSEAARAFVRDFSCDRFESLSDFASSGPLPDGLLVSNIVSERLPLVSFLERGIPVCFCKQIAPDLASVRTILASAQKGSAPVLGNSSRRFAPAFAGINAMAHRGDFGRLAIAQRFEPHDIQPGGWQDRKETSGGFIVNFGVHCVDSLCALLGPKYRSVYCAGGRYLHENAASEDSCVMTIQFEDGCIGIAEVFGAQEPFRATQPSLRVHGTKGSAEAFIDEGLIRSFRGAPLYDPRTYSFCDGMEGTVEAFVGMMRDRAQPVPFEEMLAVAEILELARISYEEGRVATAVELR